MTGIVREWLLVIARPQVQGGADTPRRLRPGLPLRFGGPRWLFRAARMVEVIRNSVLRVLSPLMQLAELRAHFPEHNEHEGSDLAESIQRICVAKRLKAPFNSLIDIIAVLRDTKVCRRVHCKISQLEQKLHECRCCFSLLVAEL